MTLPQDTRVDRRSFLQRMGAITAATAIGGATFPAIARAGPGGSAMPMSGTRFYEGLRGAGLLHPQRADPTEFTVWEAGLLLRSGRLSAQELTEAHLERIAAWDHVYRAFNAFLPDQAREDARRRDTRASGGILNGIPFVLKDNYFTAGIPTTANSDVFADFIPSFDATAVTRIREAGGVLLGKTQMGPLATTRALTSDGEITTVSAWAPRDPRVNPGGSSTGTATAVAARMAMVGTGTQTGGSITGPALAQGLTGLKPTMGRVSLHGVIPLSYTRDHPGPLARNALDAAILLQVMAGPDPKDPRTIGVPPVPDLLTAATPVERGGSPVLRWPTRVGVPAGWADGESPRGGLRRAFLEELRGAGAEIVGIDFPEAWADLTSSWFNNVRLVERTEPFLEHLRGDVRKFGVTLSSWINGLLLSGDEYLKGQRAKLALLRLVLEEVMDRCDVVLLPSHVPFDIIGLPLIAFPIGFEHADGMQLPEGVILGGLPFGEERLLSVAAAYQARTEWHRRGPPDPEGEPGRPSGVGGGESREGAIGRGRLDLEAVAELSE